MLPIDFRFSASSSLWQLPSPSPSPSQPQPHPQAQPQPQPQLQPQQQAQQSQFRSQRQHRQQQQQQQQRHPEQAEHHHHQHYYHHHHHHHHQHQRFIDRSEDEHPARPGVPEGLTEDPGYPSHLVQALPPGGDPPASIRYRDASRPSRLAPGPRYPAPMATATAATPAAPGDRRDPARCLSELRAIREEIDELREQTRVARETIGGIRAAVPTAFASTTGVGAGGKRRRIAPNGRISKRRGSASVELREARARLRVCTAALEALSRLDRRGRRAVSGGDIRADAYALYPAYETLLAADHHRSEIVAHALERLRQRSSKRSRIADRAASVARVAACAARGPPPSPSSSPSVSSPMVPSGVRIRGRVGGGRPAAAVATDHTPTPMADGSDRVDGDGDSDGDGHARGEEERDCYIYAICRDGGDGDCEADSVVEDDANGDEDDDSMAPADRGSDDALTETDLRDGSYTSSGSGDSSGARPAMLIDAFDGRPGVSGNVSCEREDADAAVCRVD